VAVNFKYGAEAFAMAGIAYGLIKWVGRNVRSLLSDAPREDGRIAALAADIPAAAGDALVRRGIVSAEDFQRMTPRERGFLLASTRLPARESVAEEGAKRTTPPPGATTVTSTATTTATTRRSAPTPTRLHLITPSRPALGVAVHCPGCGALLDRDTLQRLGAATCQRCKRPISAHIQRDRLTVIVEATPEEAEHRRRLDGSLS
jgi:hypothetical protein